MSAVSKTPWLKIAIFCLTGYLIIGTFLLLSDHFSSGGEDDSDQAYKKLAPSNDPMVGRLYGLELAGERDYLGCHLAEYNAYDLDGNLVTILRDSASDEVRAFTIILPLASQVKLTMEQALETATALAGKVSFFDDPQLRLKSKELVDSPYALNKYYQFRWEAVDSQTEAGLLRWINIMVQAESGQVMAFSSYDGGAVSISTQPEISREQAEEIGLAALSDLENAAVDKAHLYVSVLYGKQQKLVWRISVREDEEEYTYIIDVFIDAVTGEILEKPE